jgi:hypothetical protein
MKSLIFGSLSAILLATAIAPSVLATPQQLVAQNDPSGSNPRDVSPNSGSTGAGQSQTPRSERGEIPEGSSDLSPREQLQLQQQTPQGQRPYNSNQGRPTGSTDPSYNQDSGPNPGQANPYPNQSTPGSRGGSMTSPYGTQGGSQYNQGGSQYNQGTTPGYNGTTNPNYNQGSGSTNYNQGGSNSNRGTSNYNQGTTNNSQRSSSYGTQGSTGTSNNQSTQYVPGRW